MPFLRPVLALIAAGLPASADPIACSAPGLGTIAVEIDGTACIVDGRRARLVRPGPPAVCHVSNPQLRILTVAEDGGFTWEDTDDDRVFRGTCRPA